MAEGLLLTKEAWDAAWRHVREEAPREAVGAFVGTAGRVIRTVPLPNVHPSPEVAYRAAPQALFRLLRKLEAEGLELLAFYHSHPKGLALPSSTDRDEAYWRVPYVIFGLGEGRARAWRLPNGEEVPIRVEP